MLGVPLGLGHPRLRRLWALGVVAWLAGLVGAGLRERERGADPATAATAAAAVGTMHLSYGAGFWRGVLTGGRRWVARIMKVGS